jgi:hypothetical protein
MIELLLELFGEFLIQVIAEVLIEFGLRALVEPFQNRPNAWVAGVDYTLFGLAIGGLSLLVFPTHLVNGNTLRWLNLIVTPIGVGLIMSALGAWRLQRGQSLIRIDQFAYGYLFALSIALVRFWFAK